MKQINSLIQEPFIKSKAPLADTNFNILENDALNSSVNDNIRNTKISPSEIHGHGLFATTDIAAGTLLSKLDGQIIEFSTFEKMKSELKLNHEAEVALFMEWNSLPKERLLVRMFRTKYSYINHSHTPNCKLLGSPPELWSCGDIKENDELKLDYRDEPLPKEYLIGHGSSYLNANG